MKARDEFGHLLCQYPDQFLSPSAFPLPPCGAKIRALTGLQELMAMKAHLERKHQIAGLTIDRLLEVRAKWEENENVAGVDDVKVLKFLKKRNG